MHYVTPPLKKNYLNPTKNQKILHTEDNFYEVQTTKCTKTLYQTGTIRPTLHHNKIHNNQINYNTAENTKLNNTLKCTELNYTILHESEEEEGEIRASQYMPFGLTKEGIEHNR